MKSFLSPNAILSAIAVTASAIAVTALFVACGHHEAGSDNAAVRKNPFFEPGKLAFKAPAFDQIRDSDFRPAFDSGISQQMAEIAMIAGDTAAPGFDNTLVALEKSGQLLNRISGVFNLLTGANTDSLLQQVKEEEAPRLAAVHDAIFLNGKLLQRIQALWAKRGQLALDPESAYLLDYYRQQFQLAGAGLSDSAKAVMKGYNQEEATLMAKFSNKLLAANKAGALVTSRREDLAGLPDAALQSAAGDAKAAGQDGKWLIPLQNTTQQPSLPSLTDRPTRQKLFTASYTRAEKNDSNDTRTVIARIAMIRAGQAHLLGYKNYADWKLRDQMAKTPEAVENFLGRLRPAVIAKAQREAKDIQALIDQQKGGFALQAWDWNFYAEQVRKARYDLDEGQVKPYFELDKVLRDGVFYAANQLYGLTFKERKDLPLYQPDVRVFDVFDQDGSQLGLFYCDYFKRDNKEGGAWMNTITGQSFLLEEKPVVYNVCNFTKPAAGQPALLSYDNVVTMFHEFGHALHGLFAHQRYPSLASPNTARDFVEYPSQFNEHWALYPTILAHYAVDYKTGSAMPQALVDKIKKSQTFNQGYALTEILAADAIDMAWHTLAADNGGSGGAGNGSQEAGNGSRGVDSFEAAALHRYKLDLAAVPPRYRSTYFLHIWSNGYAAGYYAYTWTKMLADDSFGWFTENGGLNRKNGQRFRDMILSKGNTEDYGTMFRAFRGRDPDIRPMEVNKGL
jgi:peptidyl-dipeptidase Dcp